MITLMLVEGVGSGRRVWERIDSHQDRGEALEATQVTLRNRVEEMYPAILYDTASQTIDFQGSAERLVFLASPPLSERPGALRRYTLGLDTAANLVLASTSDISPPGQGLVTRQVLLRGVRQLDLAYFGAGQSDLGRSWRRSWTDETEPPEAIRVRLIFEPGDGRHWPDLIIRPLATIDTGCMLNPVTHHCKGRL